MTSINLTKKLLITIWLCTFLAAASPIVEIKNGTLEGKVLKTRKGREFSAFLGIPYAIPPLGNLRFQPPQPADSWTGVRSAINNGPICTQKDVFVHEKDVKGEENCLYLNVYTPKVSASEYKTYYPVMVFIHGGAFISGAGHMYGPNYLLDHDVVLVTSNYRLGAIGFLSTDDMTSPGNIGMKDQVQMLKWVQENIASFGGDFNKVTIFGESAGAASVYYHMISPLSKGLFHRAIAQSGAPLNPWGSGKSQIGKEHSQRLAKYLGCPTESSTELINCLRKIDAAKIIDAEKIFQIFSYDPVIPFRIVPEPIHPGAFLIEEPIDYLKKGKMADIPLMSGLTSHEGAIVAAPLYGVLKEKNYIEKLNDNFAEIAPMTLLQEELQYTQWREEDLQQIRKFYFGDKAIDESTKSKVIDMYTDIMFALGVDMTVKYHFETLSSPVYYYYFAYRGSSSWSAIFGDPNNDYGVCHADELLYLFPLHDFLFPNTPMTSEDNKMIDFLTNMWYSFAKTGNPTPEITQNVPTKWEPVRTDALEHLTIENSKKLKMSINLNKDRLQFWKNLMFKKNHRLPSKEEL